MMDDTRGKNTRAGEVGEKVGLSKIKLPRILMGKFVFSDATQATVRVAKMAHEK